MSLLDLQLNGREQAGKPALRRSYFYKKQHIPITYTVHCNTPSVILYGAVQGVRAWLQAPCRKQRRQGRIQHSAHAVPPIGELDVRRVARLAWALAMTLTLALAQKGAWRSSTAGMVACLMGLCAYTTKRNETRCLPRHVIRRPNC